MPPQSINPLQFCSDWSHCGTIDPDVHWLLHLYCLWMEIMKQMRAALDLLELLLQLWKHQLKAVRGNTDMQLCCMPSLGELRCSYMASFVQATNTQTCRFHETDWRYHKTKLCSWFVLIWKKLEGRVASDEDLKLSDTLRYYMRDSAAAKNLLYRRLRALANYETSTKDLEKARSKNKSVQAVSDLCYIFCRSSCLVINWLCW